ncbi:BrnA antitoxin family protein [Paraburkholderia sp. J94]|uniref:BrnA antitoxin family protein n=1 Tax=Paraburkholderia sp. J94 TaxID=2805441 RepID=UPI002AB2BDAD|nr:BrnA antitoxin family protein [Paraburkholderia sp. J94]
MTDTHDFSEAKRGPIVDSKGKTRITIMLDDDILQAFRERARVEGKGYQTLINDALRNALKAKQEPEILAALKQISDSFAHEQALREKENRVFMSSIADASEAFDKALLAVEHSNAKASLPPKELDKIRHAVNVVDVVKGIMEATHKSPGVTRFS